MENWIERLAPLLAQGGWDRHLAGAVLVGAGDGTAEVRLPVGEALANPARMLHGGAIATLVDDVGTLAVMTADRQGRSGVSTDIHVSYLAPALVGDVVIARAKVRKAGRTMAFVAVEVRRESDGAMVAEGLMTKHLS